MKNSLNFLKGIFLSFASKNSLHFLVSRDRNGFSGCLGVWNDVYSFNNVTFQTSASLENICFRKSDRNATKRASQHSSPHLHQDHRHNRNQQTPTKSNIAFFQKEDEKFRVLSGLSWHLLLLLCFHQSINPTTVINQSINVNERHHLSFATGCDGPAGV